MKHILYVILLILGIVGCEKPKDGFVVEIVMDGLQEGTALLQRRVDSRFITIDSSSFKNGGLTFSGKIDNPEMCYVYIADTLPYIRFFIENSRIKIESHVDSLRNPDVNGSKTHDLLSAYNDLMKPYEEQLQEAYREYQKAYINNDTSLVAKMEAKFDFISDKQKIISLKFIKENNESVVSPYLVWGTLAYDLEVSELEALSKEFSPDLYESIYVKQINDYISVLRNVAVGQNFQEIALPDTTGQLQKLSSLKGKLILIDFWASWCRPCRRENPKVVALYNEYKDQNFEIFGVSLDESKDRWIKAIQEDNLTWYHVSDLKGWNSEGSKKYGVRAIPHTVLINQDGIIVDKNLRGEALRKRIEELLKS
jgi:peroxiredoxin